jgi:hypothetical protein
MGRNDGVEVRKERIAKVNETLVATLYADKDKAEIPLDIAVAELEYNTGLTAKRILEYASIGEKRGRFVVDVQNNRIRKPES